MADAYSTKNVSEKLKKELIDIEGRGSVEIFIQDYNVIQITEKNIKKPNNAKG